MCSKARDVLVRCQIDETQKWHFVCPGVCWKSVSGGIEDAKGVQDEYPHYRYGGMVSFLEGSGEECELMLDVDSGKTEVRMGQLVLRNPRG